MTVLPRVMLRLLVQMIVVTIQVDVLMVSIPVLMVPAYLITGNVMAGMTAPILVMKPVAEQKPVVTVHMTLPLTAVNAVIQQPMSLVLTVLP
jgi:hypothetical protein